MDRDQVIATIRPLLPDLRRGCAVKSLYLFGSVSRGESRADSDVDVLVEFEDGAKVTLFTLADVHARLTDALGCKVDVGTLSSLRPRLRPQVEREMLRVDVSTPREAMCQIADTTHFGAG